EVGRGVRLPGGHPEGYLEAFANLYQALADGLVDGLAEGAGPAWLPGIADGVDGMRFIAGAIASSQSDGAWTTLHDGGRDSVPAG
ncbi:MAG: hypothetical protein J5F18_06960, partial [Halomonas sp. BM-2019]